MSKILISELLRNTLQSLWQLINGLGKWCCNTGHGNSHSFIPSSAEQGLKLDLWRYLWQRKETTEHHLLTAEF